MEEFWPKNIGETKSYDNDFTIKTLSEEQKTDYLIEREILLSKVTVYSIFILYAIINSFYFILLSFLFLNIFRVMISVQSNIFNYSMIIKN